MKLTIVLFVSLAVILLLQDVEARRPKPKKDDKEGDGVSAEEGDGGPLSKINKFGRGGQGGQGKRRGPGGLPPRGGKGKEEGKGTGKDGKGEEESTINLPA